jgi:hypothetical protein
MAYYHRDVSGRIIEEPFGTTIAYEVLAAYPKGQIKAVTVQYVRSEGYFLAIIAVSGMTIWSNKLPYPDSLWGQAVSDLRSALAEHDCPEFEIADPRSVNPSNAA